MKIMNISIKFVISLILAIGLNNLIRQVGALDSSTMALFFALASLNFVLGTLIYKIENFEPRSRTGFVFILAGILIIIALSLNGFVSSKETLLDMLAFEPLSFFGIIIAWVCSIINILGISLFFYACINLFLSLKKHSNKI